MEQITDVETRKDIELLVDTFYNRVKQDDAIGHIFHKIIGEDWSHHLPVMYMFWETVLLQKPGYTGNPIGKHIDVDRRVTLNDEHYERWLTLWHQTVNDLFAGPVAEEAKKRAGLMIDLIRMKVEMARNRNSIL